MLRPLPSSATGLPLYLRTTLPTCRAHYPGGSRGCACRLLPHTCGLPQMTGGSASALELSRPARASLCYGPSDRSAAQGRLCRRAPTQPVPRPAACQLPDQSTIIRVRPSLTDSSRPRGARSIASIPRCTRRVRSSPDNGHSLPTFDSQRRRLGIPTTLSALLRPVPRCAATLYYLLLIATLARPRLVEQVQRRID